MVKLIKSFSFVILVCLNIIVGLLFILAYFGLSIDPKDWWYAGFFSLFLPYLFFLNLMFMLTWLFIRPSHSLFSLLILILGSFQLRSHYSFNNNASFELSNNPDLRILNWNIRHFIPFAETRFKPDNSRQTEKVFDVVRKYKPDIICFQEFISIPSLGQSDPINYLRKTLGYKYVQFEGEDIFGSKNLSGNAIFSRYPIVKSGVIKFPPDIKGQTENMAFADLIVSNDTVRIFSVHLKSFGFGEREYRAIDEVKTESDYDVRESKNILRKMRNTFRWHGLQSDFIYKMTRSSPYPYILTGDLNDVPTSYAYETIKGELQDAFIEKGSGLGATFISATSSLLRILPTLRIDYIFADTNFKTTQFLKGGKRISDHLFIMADFNLRTK